MINSILVVCVGNICRSPIGERLLQTLLPDRTIASAGIAALVGHSADPLSVEVAAEHQLDLTGHVARQLTAEMCQPYDLILVMEKRHVDGVCQIAPEARGKIMLFGHWLQQQIRDPYGQDKMVFEQVYSLLERSAKEWLKKLM